MADSHDLLARADAEEAAEVAALEGRASPFSALYAHWERNQWSALALDLETDRRSFEALDPSAQSGMVWIFAHRFHAEFSVARLLAPFLLAAPSYDVQLLLATQVSDEHRHLQAVLRIYEEVFGVRGGIDAVREVADRNMDLVAEALYERLEHHVGKLSASSSEDDFLAAVVVYHLLAEGVIARTAQNLAANQYERLSFPGLAEGQRLVSRDEARHIGIGVSYVRRRMQQAPERTSEVITGLIEELLGLWADLLGPADAQLGDLVRSGYGIEPVDFYSEALRLVQVRLASVGYDAGLATEPSRHVRVCILTDYYYPQLGGITEHVHGQAVNLAARGHEVTIVTGRLPHAPRAADRDERVIAADGVELVHMGVALPLYGNGSQTLHTVLPLGTPQLRRFFAARQFDVVHIHAPYNPSFFMLAPFALPSGAIGVGTYHSVFTPGRLRDLVHAPTRASLSRLDGHIVVSDACIEPLDHYFPEFSWRVIPNGIDEQHFAPTAPPIAALRESGDPVVLFLGRFDPRNGLGIMLDAFSEVWRAREGRVRLAVVGDGPLRRYYQSRLAPEIADAVHWAGRIDWNRPRYYCSADVFCTPCQRASFGMVLLEAMSCGRPVVGSLISGFERLLTSGREGLLVAPTDEPASFAAALLHLLDSPGELSRMGAEGRLTATSRYSWGNVAAELEAFYLELRGEARRPLVPHALPDAFPAREAPAPV